MLSPRVWALLGMMALSDGLLACDLACKKEGRDKPPTTYTGGRVNKDRTVYETNAWNEAFVEFPAGRRLLIEHGLSAPPEVFTWLAFDEKPFDRDNGNSAESAGNMVIIQKVDEREIVVFNDTCQDFYLRLVAISPGEFESPGAGGAGGSGD